MAITRENFFPNQSVGSLGGCSSEKKNQIFLFNSTLLFYIYYYLSSVSKCLIVI